VKRVAFRYGERPVEGEREKGITGEGKNIILEFRCSQEKVGQGGEVSAPRKTKKGEFFRRKEMLCGRG